MITVTFSPETPQQIAALTQAMLAYLGTTPVEAEAPEAPTEAPKTVVRKLKKPEAPAAETLAPAAEASAVTLEQVRAKLTELSQGGKKDDIKVLIAKFGGTKLTDLKAEQYADVLAAAEAL